MYKPGGFNPYQMVIQMWKLGRNRKENTHIERLNALNFKKIRHLTSSLGGFYPQMCIPDIRHFTAKRVQARIMDPL